MHNFRKRAWLLLGMGLLAVPLAAVGLAHACTGLATVSSNPGSGAVGATVTVSGKGFTPHEGGDPSTAPAEIRLDSQSGPALATANPVGGPAGGSFSVPITVPNVPAGDHVLIVTQVGEDGTPAYGTPARTVLTVTPAPAPAPAAQLAAPPAAAAAAQPAPSGASAPKPDNSAALAKAVSTCKSKYSARKAKSKAGKKRMKSKRAACVSKAKSRFS